MCSISNAGSPYSSFRRAVSQRLLVEAESAARQLGAIRSEDALALVLLMRDEHDSRFGKAATRWLGSWLAINPHAGLNVASQLADGSMI